MKRKDAKVKWLLTYNQDKWNDTLSSSHLLTVSGNFIKCVEAYNSNPSIHSLIYPHSMSCRGGLWPPRYSSSRSDERGEVYIWLHCALFLLWRPPAHRRVITHLSTEWTLECSTAPLFRYTNTCRYSHALMTLISVSLVVVWFCLLILTQPVLPTQMFAEWMERVV